MQRIALNRTAANRTVPWVAFAVGLTVAPFVLSGAHARLQLIMVLLYSLLAVSWNLTLGLAGIFNFAQIAFFGIGAYTTAVLCTRSGLSPWIAMLVSASTAALAAVVAFLPVLRLRGIYVGLVTYVFAQLCVYLVLGQRELTGGSNGVVGLPDLTVGSLNFYDDDRLGYYFLGAVLLFAVCLAFALLTRSRLGLSLVALRNNEALAASRGVRRARQQLAAFVIGAAVAGVAGSYQAFVNSVVSTDVFGFGYLTILLSMIFLGGRRSNPGTIVGVVVITVLSDVLADSGAWQQIISSAITLVVLWLFPDGLAGLARSWGGRGLLRLIRPAAAATPPAQSVDRVRDDPALRDSLAADR
ncbi:branched-chain amino acid ABC transporter permease [Pseudonocardia kujensis]|uniref:branched-chain amino acid ABC transporter permease n=1 Tax=Pseudonocardia kujensis TaxID=1128675 RepID=UPI001E2E168B|nr:branched-chain amino acid ABC transporter permease [Pseudonocardia kujensis]MCE0768088.1 branched-chain amino acid ABC transporter permease [Pseudonocardia kujensis]